MPDNEKVTVMLIPRAATVLDIRAAVNGDTRTDTINRAILLYDAAESIRERGGLRAWLLRKAGLNYS